MNNTRSFAEIKELLEDPSTRRIGPCLFARHDEVIQLDPLDMQYYRDESLRELRLFLTQDGPSPRYLVRRLSAYLATQIKRFL